MRDEIKESINYRLLLIIDITLDSAVIILIILNFYFIDKFMNYLGYHNQVVTDMINLGHDPIIIFGSLIVPTIISFFKKNSFMPNNSIFKIEIIKKPNNSSVNNKTELDVSSKNKGKEPETSKKEPETSKKEPETSKKEPETSKKEPETSGKKPKYL
jgi:hypothetical protein